MDQWYLNFDQFNSRSEIFDRKMTTSVQQYKCRQLYTRSEILHWKIHWVLNTRTWGTDLNRCPYKVFVVRSINLMIQCHWHMVQLTNHHLQKAIKSRDECVTSTTVYGRDKFSMRSAVLLLNAVFLASALDTQVIINTNNYNYVFPLLDAV